MYPFSSEERRRSERMFIAESGRTSLSSVTETEKEPFKGTPWNPLF